MEFLKNKTFIALALGVVVLGLFLGKKNNSGSALQMQGYDTEARNSTVFIPTSETNIDYVAGNQTISNSDSRQTVNAGAGAIITIPKTTATLPSTPSPSTGAKYKTLTKPSSIFTNLNSEFSIGELAPQRVEVLQENPSGWLLIKSWKGNVWVKDGYIRPKAPAGASTKTHTLQKGDTLWSLAGGDKNKLKQITQLNGITNANKIYAGVNIKLPV